MSQTGSPHAPSIATFSGRYANRSHHEQPTYGGVIEDDPEFNTDNYIAKIESTLNDLPPDEKALYLLALFKQSITTKAAAEEIKRAIGKMDDRRKAKLRALETSAARASGGIHTLNG